MKIEKVAAVLRLLIDAICKDVEELVLREMYESKYDNHYEKIIPQWYDNMSNSAEVFKIADQDIVDSFKKYYTEMTIRFNDANEVIVMLDNNLQWIDVTEEHVDFVWMCIKSFQKTSIRNASRLISNVTDIEEFPETTDGFTGLTLYICINPDTDK